MSNGFIRGLAYTYTPETSFKGLSVPERELELGLLKAFRRLHSTPTSENRSTANNPGSFSLPPHTRCLATLEGHLDG